MAEDINSTNTTETNDETIGGGSDEKVKVSFYNKNNPQPETQPDYFENDENSPSYIKNRIGGYSALQTIKLFDGEVKNWSTVDDKDIVSSFTQEKEGTPFIINLDDVEYKCELDSSPYHIGDETYVKYPFYINYEYLIDSGLECICFRFNDSDSHKLTMSILKVAPVTIPKEYLPSLPINYFDMLANNAVQLMSGNEVKHLYDNNIVEQGDNGASLFLGHSNKISTNQLSSASCIIGNYNKIDTNMEQFLIVGTVNNVSKGSPYPMTIIGNHCSPDIVGGPLLCIGQWNQSEDELKELLGTDSVHQALIIADGVVDNNRNIFTFFYNGSILVRSKGGRTKQFLIYVDESGTIIVEDLTTKTKIYGGGIKTDSSLSFVDGKLSVNAATTAEADNNLPITSAAVYSLVGNIETLLSQI